MGLSVSVIIATYNRAALLDECLVHLARQPFRPGDEAIVVDNGSSDDTASVIRSHARTFPVPLRHLNEARRGKSHSLGRALEVAGGDLLAFTDDDVIVDPGWLEAIRSAMTDTRIALIGGPIDARWERRAPRWLRLHRFGYGRLAAPLALLDYGPVACDLGIRTAMGGNMAVRRDVLQQVGGFAPHLGKVNGTLLSGEDHEFCERVQAAGFSARYCPAARVRHFVPAERLRIGYFLSWFFWSGITNRAIEETRGTDRTAEESNRTSLDRQRSIAGIPLYIVRRFATGTIRTLGALCGRDSASAVDHAVDVAFAAGYAARCWHLVAIGRTARLKPRITWLKPRATRTTKGAA